MVSLRSRRLEGILGGPLDAVTPDHVRALVKAGATEAFDLDFKREYYGRSDSDRRALCSDVAALANTAGGLIIIGVAEDDQARATGAPGVEVTDAEVARIRQVVAAGVSPLPTFDVLPLLDDDESSDSTGFILIAVPSSVLAPHAVLVHDSLRFPARNGSTTRYLSEPEVAARYRERLLRAAERAEQAPLMERELTARLDLSDDAWLVTTLAPERPGDLEITRATLRKFEDEVTNERIVPIDSGGPQVRRVDVGPQRLRADDAYNNDGPYAIAMDLRTDGVGAFAYRLWNIDRATEGRPSDVAVISEEEVAAALIAALEQLARHARDRTGTSGMAQVRATIVPSTGTPTATTLGHDRSMGFPRASGRPVTVMPPVDAFAAIDDLAEGGRDLVRVAARLHRSLGHVFGVAELRQLTPDGSVAWPYWGQERRPHLRAWASKSGVPITGQSA